MITGSAARNPEELGPGFLNIHKTLMSLYSALHQGMSAIYIMLPLRSVTASLSFTESLACLLLLLPRLYFSTWFLSTKGLRAMPFPFCFSLSLSLLLSLSLSSRTLSLLSLSLPLLLHECLHFPPMSWTRWDRDRDRGRKRERGECGLGKVVFFFLRGFEWKLASHHLYKGRISKNKEGMSV